MVGNQSVSNSYAFEFLIEHEKKHYEAYNNGDYETAMKLWMKGAKPDPTGFFPKGNKTDQYLVAILYFEGKGVPQDYETALKWYTISAEQNHPPAMLKLGKIYSYGLGVPVNYAKSITWFRKLLINMWDPTAKEAAFELGLMNYEGKGYTQDFIRAHMWWNIGSSEGHEQSRKSRDFVAERMTPNQVEKAQELAKKCRRSLNFTKC